MASSGPGFPRTNVLIPVMVARGISGSVSVSSLSMSIQFFRLWMFFGFFLCAYQDCFHGCFACALIPTKTERKAEIHTIPTARELSIICQKFNQTRSTLFLPMRIAEIRIIAMRIITIERHNISPRIIFWRRFIWTFQSSCTGITITAPRTCQRISDGSETQVERNITYSVCRLLCLT